MDILQLLQTKSNAEIARILGKHPGTIVRLRKKHGIPGKLGAPRRKKQLPQIPCIGCGAPILPRDDKHKFCSHPCRGKFYASPEWVAAMSAGSRQSNHRTAERGWGNWMRKPSTPEYRKYANKVHRLTRHTYNEHRAIINPNDYPRTLAGVPGGWQLDHKVSARYGFDNGWPAEQVAAAENLQMLPWRTNIKKGKHLDNLL